jgi:hypothetical protein
MDVMMHSSVATAKMSTYHLLSKLQVLFNESFLDWLNPSVHIMPCSGLLSSGKALMEFLVVLEAATYSVNYRKAGPSVGQPNHRCGGPWELTDTVLEHSACVTPEVFEALLATMSPLDYLRATRMAPFQVAPPVRLKAHYSSPAALSRFRASPQISCRITNTVAWGLRSAYLSVTLRHGLEADGSRCFDEDLAKHT